MSFPDLSHWPSHNPKPLSEAEIIARRIASNRKWRNRRTHLRLKALLFGRRKPQSPTPAPSPNSARCQGPVTSPASISQATLS